MIRRMRDWAGLLGVLAALVGIVPAATAGISTVIYHVEVCNDAGVCVGTMPIDYSDTYWQPDGTFRWQLTQDTDVMDLLGMYPVATLTTEGFGTSITITPPGPGRANPQVNVNFSVIGGSSPGLFTITSALVSFATIYNADGQVNVGINLTDRTTNGASLTNAPTYGAKSSSWVNGLPTNVVGGTGSLFHELFPQDLTIAAGSGGSVGDTDQTLGYEPIGMDVSSISGQIKFGLSARDLASGSSTFIVTPEPASFCLLLALALLRRR